jgi:8-oxo-dGTP diphosphatase
MNGSSESAFLQQYRASDYPSPLLTVDVTLFSLDQGQLQVLLVKRADFPHKGQWALPGGFVDMLGDKDLEATARRKLTEKTTLQTPWLEQVCSVGNAQRDPRGWSVTALYMALVSWAPVQAAIASVADARWWPLDQIESLELAFDHRLLIDAARERLRNKTAYTILPIHVVPQPFTLTQLQQAFEVLLGTPLEKKSFRRRLLNADVLREVSESPPEGGKGRPAALFEPCDSGLDHRFVRVFG